MKGKIGAQYVIELIFDAGNSERTIDHTLVERHLAAMLHGLADSGVLASAVTPRGARVHVGVVKYETEYPAELLQ